jgi:polyisoprenoid-binding protein YceI
VINGAATTNGNGISGGSFEIDMTSIRNDDIGNDDMRKKLLGHLKSKDFFYVEKYPKAVFTISGVEKGEGNGHNITGDLTIRGNTKEISFPVAITMDEEMIHARSDEIILDRTHWEVNHMSRSVFAQLKDRFINDEMIIKLDLHFSRN